MSRLMGAWERPFCGGLRAADVGRRTELVGWVRRRRDLGGIIFVDLALAQTAAFGTCIAMLAGYTGLLLSFYANLPSGPSIILTAGLCYAFSVVFGWHGSIYGRHRQGEHLEG